MSTPSLSSSGLSLPAVVVSHKRRDLAHLLFGWRVSFGFGRLESVVLAGYALLVACVVPHHEPWADEAQAWMIARDNSLWQIFRYRLHYEGAPGLWHFCLHLLHQLGGGYAAMHWMGAAFALVGMALFLRWSPFPLLLRVLLPFTFFFAYQYAVVARGYTLFPAFAFALCALFPHRRQALWFALLAGLLANISMQGTIHSFVLVALYFWQHSRGRAENTEPSRARWWLTPAAVYLVFFLFAGITAVPAPDVTVAGGPGPVSGSLSDTLLGIFPGRLPASEYLPAAPLSAVRAAALYKPRPLPMFPPEDWTVKPSLWRHPGSWAGWYARHPIYDSTGHFLPPSNAQGAALAVLELVTLATAPVSTFKLLACAFLLALTLWLWIRKGLRFLLPWAANVIVGQALWVSDHHTGLFLIALLSAVWLASPGYLPETGRTGRSLTAQRLEPVLLLLLTLVCMEQIAWTATAVRSDLYGQYDGSTEAAAFLQAHPFRHMASFDSTAIGVQPYFASNPFFNMPHGYWVWSTVQNPNGRHAVTIAERPDAVLFSQDMIEHGFTHNDWAPLSPVSRDRQNRDLGRNDIIRDLVAHGYRETHRFCGQRFFRFKPSYEACDLIFEPQARVF